MAQDALGIELREGDWLACIRGTRCSFSIFPAKLIEIKEGKSFVVYCGKINKYNYTLNKVEETEDLRTLHAFHNVLKVFPENLPEDVYFVWRDKLENLSAENEVIK